MELEEFKKICACFIGSFEKSEFGQIRFCNKNEITSYYQDGTIHTQKKVDCEIELGNNGMLSAFEKTYAILGGCGGYDGTRENLKKLLIRFNFQIKDQISFFDVLEDK